MTDGSEAASSTSPPPKAETLQSGATGASFEWPRCDVGSHRLLPLQVLPRRVMQLLQAKRIHRLLHNPRTWMRRWGDDHIIYRAGASLPGSNILGREPWGTGGFQCKDSNSMKGRYVCSVVVSIWTRRNTTICVRASTLRQPMYCSIQRTPNVTWFSAWVDGSLHLPPRFPPRRQMDEMVQGCLLACATALMSGPRGRLGYSSSPPFSSSSSSTSSSFPSSSSFSSGFCYAPAPPHSTRPSTNEMSSLYLPTDTMLSRPSGRQELHLFTSRLLYTAFIIKRDTRRFT